MTKNFIRFFITSAFLAFAIAGCSTAPKDQLPPPAPAPAPEPEPAPSFVIEGVNFAFDSDRLEPSAQATLDQAARALRNQPNVPYEVNGHTDSIGSASYNQDLSERRANAVARALVRDGVSPDQLSVAGFGENNPIATNETAAGRAQNRRVEIRPRQ
ncbi:MAG: OmpA family protein [Candidatus Competibacteraceae bacterium]|nr:OmpA family protein [Candidatus Competibacteraceae bacterium]